MYYSFCFYIRSRYMSSSKLYQLLYSIGFIKLKTDLKKILSFFKDVFVNKKKFNEYNFFSCDGSLEVESSIETDISQGVHIGASKYDFEYYDVLCSCSMHLHKIPKISSTK